MEILEFKELGITLTGANENYNTKKYMKEAAMADVINTLYHQAEERQSLPQGSTLNFKRHANAENTIKVTVTGIPFTQAVVELYAYLLVLDAAIKIPLDYI